MKRPTQCACPVHTTADYSKYSRDVKLLRRVRQDSLANARRWRAIATLDTDLKEREFLELCAVCAEWSAWVYLLILRDIKIEKPIEIAERFPVLGEWLQRQTEAAR